MHSEPIYGSFTSEECDAQIAFREGKGYEESSNEEIEKD